MKFYKRLFSYMLSFAIAFGGALLPFSVKATTAEPAEVVRLGEISYMRETNSETYLLSDRSYECIIYPEDKYYRDSSNTLQLIDNSIIIDENSSKPDIQQFKNTANSFNVTFSNTETPSVTLDKESYSITFSSVCVSEKSSPYTSPDKPYVKIGSVKNYTALNDLTVTGNNTIMYANAYNRVLLKLRMPVSIVRIQTPTTNMTTVCAPDTTIRTGVVERISDMIFLRR